MSTNNVTVTQKNNQVNISQLVNRVTITAPGPQGPPGPQGDPAASFYFSQDFTNASTVLVEHNLGAYPNVEIIVAGVAVDADVAFNDLNSLTVAFGAPYTGTVVCS